MIFYRWCILLCLSSLLYAETFWSEENNALTNDLFIQKYFYKPLKYLKDSYITIKVLNISRLENLEDLCSQFELNYNKQQNVCSDDSGKQICYLHPNDVKQMQQYILESEEFPYNTYNGGYMFMEDNACAYVGKVEVFGYIWDFYSRGGSIILSRNLELNETIVSIEQDSIKAYRQGLIEENKAKKYLVCKNIKCQPRALNINE